MKCENCGKNEVTFVYQSNINGQITEKHLCSECAQKLGYPQAIAAQSRRMMEGMRSLWSGFGGGLLNGFFEPEQELPGGRFFGEDLFDDFFREMPALGAAPVEQTPQAPAKQEIPVSEEEQSRFGRARKLNQLRMELKKAVHTENFERAAELRDQIHAMEKEKRESK
jgi:protein arginine kinase activator